MSYAERFTRALVAVAWTCAGTMLTVAAALTVDGQYADAICVLLGALVSGVLAAPLTDALHDKEAP